MCGIFGIINRNPDNNYIRSITEELFLLSESRGKEASGFAMDYENKIIVHKSPQAASKMIKTKEFKNCFKEKNKDNFIFIGHSRLVTNGYEHFNYNNQPFIKNGIVGIHNGIIVNIDELWKKYNSYIHETDLDSEIIPVIIKHTLLKNENLEKAINILYSEIVGMTNIALLYSEYNNLVLATNNGSLYYYSTENLFIFASESVILEKIISKFKLDAHNDIKHLSPNYSLCIDTINLKTHLVDFKENIAYNNENLRTEKNRIEEVEVSKEINNNKIFKNASLEHIEIIVSKEFINHYNDCKDKISNLRRCKKCLLPETFPHIHFDENGVCNVCNSYIKQEVYGKGKILREVEKFKNNLNKPDCIVAFSGGRDSSYSLHYVKKILGLNPIAYSYDWGMITDLARRNQARMCGKLGVEHILVSADIRKKRNYIKKNVTAWLHKPHLGTIPLFMAGDKQYFYFAEQIKKQYGIDLLIMGENPYEKTGFKIEFSGARQEQKGFMSYHMSKMNKFRMLSFYAKEYLTNPYYLNKSLIDTVWAYISYYGINHNYLNLYDYIYWNEEELNHTLINEYDWETEPGYDSTWRIGDGTAPFYNYIYYIVAGFSENDTLRSNQIREGILSREIALKKSIEENKPRWNSIKWYCDTIGIDFEETIKRINKIKKLY